MSGRPMSFPASTVTSGKLISVGEASLTALNNPDVTGMAAKARPGDPCGTASGAAGERSQGMGASAGNLAR